MKKESGKDTPLFGGVLIGHCRPVSVSTNATFPAITIHPRICDIAFANPAIPVPAAIRIGMSFHSLDCVGSDFWLRLCSSSHCSRSSVTPGIASHFYLPSIDHDAQFPHTHSTRAAQILQVRILSCENRTIVCSTRGRFIYSR